MIDDIVVGFEDTVREPVVAHVLPDIFDRIEFRAFRLLIPVQAAHHNEMMSPAVTE
jgi:hypothetical protein